MGRTDSTIGPLVLDALHRAAENPLAAAVVLALGIALLLLGGQWLVHGAVAIARRLGMSTLLIGLTLVAFGTSSPELAFNVIAVASGHGELSFGNVVGSNIANIGLVLGLCAFVYSPLIVHGQVVKRELPFLILVSAGMIGLAVWGGGFDRIDGIILLSSFALFSYLWYRVGRRDPGDVMVVEMETGGRWSHLVDAAAPVLQLRAHCAPRARRGASKPN